jgi:hypothetical protein
MEDTKELTAAELDELIVRLRGNLKDKARAANLAHAESSVAHHQYMLEMMIEQHWSASQVSIARASLALAEEGLAETLLKLAEEERRERAG